MNYWLSGNKQLLDEVSVIFTVRFWPIKTATVSSMKTVFLIRAVVDLILQCVETVLLDVSLISKYSIRTWRYEWTRVIKVMQPFMNHYPEFSGSQPLWFVNYLHGMESMSCVWARLFIINFLAEYSGSQRLWILIIFSSSAQRTWVFNHDFVLHLVFCLI